jgi:hypothetical protein
MSTTTRLRAAGSSEFLDISGILLSVVANRVRENTVGYRKLMRFLDRLSIAVIGEIRDSQNYVHAAKEGLGIHEMQPSRVQKDLPSWNPILEWMLQRLQTEITPRDLYRPPDPSEPEVKPVDDSKAGYAINSTE